MLNPVMFPLNQPKHDHVQNDHYHHFMDASELQPLTSKESN